MDRSSPALPPSLNEQALALLKAMQNRINLLHTVYPNIPNGWVADQVEFARLYRALMDQPKPAEPVWDDIHYAWELEDAEGEWQAGGSANSLEDVQREGNRYLQTYSQDGPHKLIIQRHCVSTIEEATNG
tara:strand:+ start:1644 stop:2033 length:390 start_codon:yes stop_codon:yes gene_type:complete